MRDDAWKREVEVLLSSTTFDINSTRACREFLVRLDGLLLNPPSWFTNAFLGVSEEALRAESEMQMLRVVKRASIFQMSWKGDDDLIARRLGGIVRAADALLAEGVSPGLPRSPEAWRSGNHYVIPRNHKRRVPKLNQDYPRRGMLFHSILPAVVDGLKVSLHLMTIPASNMGHRSKFGAAIFPELELIERPDLEEQGIVAGSVASPNQIGVVDSQLAESAKTRLLAAVWPELTMPPDVQVHLVKKLRRSSLLEAKQAYPQIVVPGSWHEQQDDLFENVSHVFDGDGVELFAYRKRIRFIFKGRKELLKSGDELPVIVTEDYLIGFAICRDFCHMGSDSVYEKLNLDFVLVPSMGEESTMDSHRTIAKKVRSKWDTRTFVVQQVAPPRPRAPAMVLSPSANPAPSKLDVSVTEAFTIYDGHF